VHKLDPGMKLWLCWVIWLRNQDRIWRKCSRTVEFLRDRNKNYNWSMYQLQKIIYIAIVKMW